MKGIDFDALKGRLSFPKRKEQDSEPEALFTPKAEVILIIWCVLLVIGVGLMVIFFIQDFVASSPHDVTITIHDETGTYDMFRGSIKDLCVSNSCVYIPNEDEFSIRCINIDFSKTGTNTAIVPAFTDKDACVQISILAAQNKNKKLRQIEIETLATATLINASFDQRTIQVAFEKDSEETLTIEEALSVLEDPQPVFSVSIEKAHGIFKWKVALFIFVILIGVSSVTSAWIFLWKQNKKDAFAKKHAKNLEAAELLEESALLRLGQHHLRRTTMK